MLASMPIALAYATAHIPIANSGWASELNHAQWWLVVFFIKKFDAFQFD